MLNKEYSYYIAGLLQLGNSIVTNREYVIILDFIKTRKLFQKNNNL